MAFHDIIRPSVRVTNIPQRTYLRFLSCSLELILRSVKFFNPAFIGHAQRSPTPPLLFYTQPNLVHGRQIIYSNLTSMIFPVLQPVSRSEALTLFHYSSDYFIRGGGLPLKFYDSPNVITQINYTQIQTRTKTPEHV